MRIRNYYVVVKHILQSEIFGLIVRTPTGVKSGRYKRFCVNKNEHCEIVKYKARLVAQGSSQRPRVVAQGSSRVRACVRVNKNILY
jgi:hypothetical protein